MGALQGKTAVVTGGSEGIGRAIAERFVTEGACVYITGRDEAKLHKATAQIGAVPVQADASVAGDFDRLYDTVRGDGRRIDVLVANAGGAGIASFADTDEDLFDRLTDVNFKGLYITVQRALPLLVDGGSVVLLSSAAGRAGTPGLSVYGATKAAVRSLARTLGAELAGRGIRVNALSPGHTESAAFVRAGGDDLDAFRATMAAEVPLGRVAAPAEIAGAALFLASTDSSYVTGIDLPVDGGLTVI